MPSSELGNGSLVLDLDTGTDQMYLTLDLHNVSLDERGCMMVLRFHAKYLRCVAQVA